MRRAFAFLLFLAFAAPTLGQERTHDITPEDYATVNTITEIAVSPDGKQVAYCLATWDKKADNRRTDLWVVDTDGKGKPRQLTKDRGNDRHPKWSADGKAVYVLANRKTKDDPKAITRVWKIWLEPERPATSVTNERNAITGFDYASKADRVFVTYDETAVDTDDFSALRKKFDKPEYAGGKRKVSELYVLNSDYIPERLIADKRYIREFAVTPDGKRIAMVTAIDDTVLKSEGESRVDVWEGDPNDTGKPGKIVTPPTDVYRAKAASPHAWLENLAWNPDGTKFAFNAIFDAYPTEIVIGEFKEGKWGTSLLDRKRVFIPPMVRAGEMQVRGYGSPLHWIDKGSLGYLTDKSGNVNSRSYSVDAEGPFVPAGVTHDPNTPIEQEVIYAVSLSNRRVEIAGGPAGLPVLRTTAAEGNGGWTTLVDPNPHTTTWKFPSVQHITWKAPDSTEVGGPLELPYGWKKGDKPLPLVVAIHGGPTTSSPNDLRFDPHNGRLYFAAKGYAVLCPNYRGSTGYGDKFVTDLIGKENDIEVKDILAGIQHLVKEGIADPDRIAVMGWSNGGYLTNCLITLKDPPVKIKAASSGAGIVDTVAEWGFNDEPAYPKVFKGGHPWEAPDTYKKTSPTYQLQYAKTPTLIHVGANDERCPPGHSKMLHRALKEYLNVPSELIVYPGEPHGLGKLSNRTAKMEWDLAWFEKYLK